MNTLKHLLLVVSMVVLGSGMARAEAAKPLVEIYMPSPCLACLDWGSYLASQCPAPKNVAHLVV